MPPRNETIESLFEACAGADEAGISAALKAGADPNAPSQEYDGTALGVALTADCSRGAALLVEAGAHLTAKDEFGYTPLHFAAYFGDAALIRLMLARGADPKVASRKAHPSYEYFRKGSTPLDIARRDGDADRIEALAGPPAAAAPAADFTSRLAKVHGFADSSIDFEGTDGAVDESLAGEEMAPHLTALGMTGSGSVFALWRSIADAPLAAAPVVYLDSEGEPHGVVARSLEAFLTLLPYGTGHLYDVLSGARAAKAKGAAAKALTATCEAFGSRDGQTLLPWWLASFGAEPARDPAATINEARKALPELQAALAQG